MNSTKSHDTKPVQKDQLRFYTGTVSCICTHWQSAACAHSNSQLRVHTEIVSYICTQQKWKAGKEGWEQPQKNTVCFLMVLTWKMKPCTLKTTTQ